MTNGFFEETKEQSLVKATIVAKYFWVWAKVIMSQVQGTGKKIAYMDLFAGQGRYQDGTKSTPLRVLEQAINDPEMRQVLVTFFNDKNGDNSQSLERAISELPDIDKLTYRPKVMNEEVGSEMVKMFEQMRLIPTLFFVDPWGYKGLSLQLVNAVIKDWACECIFFFNYNRINMGLNNQFVEEHMNALFGKERADALRSKLQTLSPGDRELTIVEELCKALNQTNDRYVLPFRFRDDRGTRTSHHLIFVSKHFRGYDIMKRVMAGESSKQEQGVASLEYSPADRRYPVLFEMARPLDDLEAMLLNDCAGRSITFKKLYETHSVGKPYIDSNYKQVLKKLEEAGAITAEKPGKKRRRGTFADDVVIIFSQKGC
ncbi:MAG: three-Cys-motif partner protein TcmP [Verrucomicrobia bacterium]|nr:three-Cys-motif partner protein TcmP [Verrucomicrobiota bacterium]